MSVQNLHEREMLGAMKWMPKPASDVQGATAGSSSV
jgi:hypothetical protein